MDVYISVHLYMCMFEIHYPIISLYLLYDDCSIKNKSYASISHQQGSTTLVAKIDLNPVSEGMVNNIEQCRDTSTLRQSIIWHEARFLPICFATHKMSPILIKTDIFPVSPPEKLLLFWGSVCDYYPKHR